VPLPIAGKGSGAAASPFVWFIYGSSLDAKAFAAWGLEHGYAVPDLSHGRRVRLRGFRLAFDVVSRSWGGAVASLTESPGDFVEGLAVPMPGSARALVEHREGAISGLYVPLDVEVDPVDGGPALRAVAYRAAPARRLAAEGPPSPDYLATVIRGARETGLSADWIDRLEALGRRG